MQHPHNNPPNDLVFLGTRVPRWLLKSVKLFAIQAEIPLQQVVAEGLALRIQTPPEKKEEKSHV